jgi:hypothetical protein
MTVLRYIGNLGTHRENLTQEALLDAFHIYEDALAELYGNRSAIIKSLREKIISAKGEYPSVPGGDFPEDDGAVPLF